MLERKATTRGDSSLGERCTEARRQVNAFFDWAGYNDSRKRNEWETWVTQAVHQQWTLEAIHDYVKKRWIEHRKSLGLPIRIEASSPEEVSAMIAAVNAAIGVSLPHA